MCCGISRSRIKGLGIFLSLAFLLVAIICIILAGVNYNILFTSFTTDGWQSLAALEIASILYVFVLLALSLVTFWCDTWCLTIIFIIFMSLSTFFTGAIAIIALVAASWGDIDKYVGCNSQYAGVLDSWNDIDKYLIEVDTNLCSAGCPCYFDSPAEYATNTTVYKYYSQWTKGSLDGAVAFQNCSSTVQDSALTKYKAQITDPQNFYPDDFSDYWEMLETKFECSGWCKTSYQNVKTQSEMTMYKYMFTSINRGIPKYLGCLNALVRWLPPILNAFGALGVIITTLEAIVLVLSISLLCNKQKKDEVEPIAK